MSSQKPHVANVKDSVELFGAEDARLRRLANIEIESEERILFRLKKGIVFCDKNY